MRATILAVLAILVSAISTPGHLPEKPALPEQAIHRLTTGNDSSGNATHIQPVPFSPDAKTLAVAFYGTNQSIFLWDTQTGDEVQKLDGTASGFTVHISPEGKFLLSTYRELRVWELASGKTVLHIPEPNGYICAMYSGSFSPDGSLLASGGQDNAVILWDAFSLERGWEPPKRPPLP